jgi:hypothetical protein
LVFHFCADNESVTSESGDIEELLDMPLICTHSKRKAESDVEEIVEVDYDINKCIASYKEATIDGTIPRQLFTVCRTDGLEEMKTDILSAYKNPRTNLVARPRVRFEGEEGLGAGPLREFFHLSMKVVQDGIGYSPKPVIYFEGQADHKVPLHNPALRQTGSLRALGRIIGHSFLHGGPPLCGLSEAVKHYFTCKNGDMSSNPPFLEVHDVPDIDLQLLLKEVCMHVEILPLSFNPMCEYRLFCLNSRTNRPLNYMEVRLKGQ